MPQWNKYSGSRFKFGGWIWCNCEIALVRGFLQRTTRAVAMVASNSAARRIPYAPARLLAARLHTRMFPQIQGEGNPGPNCSGDDSVPMAGGVPNWAKFVSHCRIGNLGHLPLEKNGPKNDGSSAECRRRVTTLESCLISQGISFHIPRGKYPFFGFAIAAWCVSILNAPPHHDFQLLLPRFREEHE